MKLEEKLKKLEESVQQLEQDDLPLDKSLELFSSGVLLVKECQKELQAAELKVKEVLGDENSLDLVDLDDED